MKNKKVICLFILFSSILVIGCLDITEEPAEVIVDSQGIYSYNDYSDTVEIDTTLDVVNIGGKDAKNVQIDYSMKLLYQEIYTDTIYLGTLEGGESIEKSVSTVINLDHKQAKRLRMGNQIEIIVDDVRYE